MNRPSTRRLPGATYFPLYRSWMSCTGVVTISRSDPGLPGANHARTRL